MMPSIIEQSVKLKINFQMLRTNYDELIDKINQHKQPEVYERLWNYSDPEQLTEYVIDVSRLFINFISLACGVKESCRVFIRDWYDKTNFLESYQEKINELFVNNPLVQFIEDLRNVALHCSLTVVNAKGITIPNDNIGLLDTGFVLKKSRLLNFQWGKGKDFLLQQEDNIDIEPIVINYFQLVSSFYPWLIQKIAEYSNQHS